MTTAVGSHIPTAALEFVLVSAFSFVGLVLSICVAGYCVGFNPNVMAAAL